MNYRMYGVFALLLFTCAIGAAKKTGEIAAPLTISSSERVIKGSIIAPDRYDLEPFVVLFRGERHMSDRGGFFTFSKKADREVFEPMSVGQKLGQAKNVAPRLSASGVDRTRSPLLSAKKNPDKFYILITKDIEPVLEGTNNISGFRQAADKPHLFFSCVAQNAEVDDEDIVIKPRSLEKHNYVFTPDRTIVILMNPNRVKKIEYAPFKLDQQFIQLPRIVLLAEDEVAERKKSKPSRLSEESVGEDRAADTAVSPAVSSRNMKRQSVKSSMYGLDMAPFFEEPDTVSLSKRIGRNQLVEIRM